MDQNLKWREGEAIAKRMVERDDCKNRVKIIGVVSGQNVNFDRRLGEKGRGNVSILISLFITRIL